jgi:acyl-CoA thioesterase I
MTKQMTLHSGCARRTNWLRGWRPLPMMPIPSLAYAIAVFMTTLLVSTAFAQTKSIVVIGDSNIAGKGVSPSETYPAHLERILRARGLDVTVKNAGINADTTTRVLARLNSDVPDGTAVAVISVGINDYVYGGLTISQIGANQKEIERRLRARGIQTVLLLSGMKFQGSIAKDPRYHVEPPPANGDYNPKNWHLNSAGYAVIAQQTSSRVVAALKNWKPK